MKGEPHSDKQATSRNEEEMDKVRKKLQEERRSKIQKIAAVVGTSIGSVHLS